MTGPEFREFRRNHNLPIDRCAKLLGFSVWKLHTIERSTDPIPPSVAQRADILVRALTDGVIQPSANELRHSFRDFQRSIRFSKPPTFEVVPTCPCNDRKCHLAPAGDGDWDQKHLWKFVGRRCHQTRYIDSNGTIVARPRRRPPPAPQLDNFRHSDKFSQRPPFSVCPACPCRNLRCRLIPVKDGDWDQQHLWKFKGWRCQKTSYVDSKGEVVPIPRDHLSQQRLSGPPSVFAPNLVSQIRH
jgi:hypothetical protein